MLKAITNNRNLASFVAIANQTRESLESAKEVAVQAAKDARSEAEEVYYSDIARAIRNGDVIEIDEIKCDRDEYQSRLEGMMDIWSDIIPECDTATQSITVHHIAMDKQCYLDALDLDVLAIPSKSLLSICEHRSRRVKIACSK
jgi:hypothetical protein